MEYINNYKFELITFILCSGLSVLYYYDTGEVRIIGVLFLSVLLLSTAIRICSKVYNQQSVKPLNKKT